mgnify:CR=1 FL=1
MRKTTAMDFAVDIMENDPNIKRTDTFVTKESLVNSILQSPDSSLSAAVGEFSELIMKGGKEMYDLLTILYDSKRELSVSTLMRGKEGTTKPCFNLIACTTPGWISSHIPEESISGGFASRVLFVYEEELVNRRLYRTKQMIEGKLEYYNKLEVDLVHDLVHTSSALAGEFEGRPQAAPGVTRAAEPDRPRRRARSLRPGLASQGRNVSRSKPSGTSARSRPRARTRRA